MLIRLTRMDEPDRQLCKKFIQWGVLATVGQNDAACVSTEQFARLRRLLSEQASTTEYATAALQLFPSEHELLLTKSTGIQRNSDMGRDITGSEVLTQLLPRTIEQAAHTFHPTALGQISLPGQGLNVLSKNADVLSVIEHQVERFSRQAQQREKLSTLARSANYMGAKSLLCPAICEVIESYHARDGVVLDLMCGSGATAGAFAQRWNVYASDAQTFSRHLAVIQGSGMTVSQAQMIVKQVADIAKLHFDRLVDLVGADLEKEEGFLMSELTPADVAALVSWASNYPRVNTEAFNRNPTLVKELEMQRVHPRANLGTLFTRYYANLFFGVRQAAEIDSLRTAIDVLDNPHHRKWAIGALICAVSACADNYGGHFAQPRFDSTSPDKLGGKIRETLLRRTMSITQEFSARLINLAAESENVPHRVEEINGPWQHAIAYAAETLRNQPTLVYLDPPYTRDEYSRYYHVLETLVNYNYPIVSGKASIPIKGQDGRFSSEFFTRSVSSVEETIVKVISACLEQQWPCLWSYSSTGIADIESVIQRLEQRPRGVDIYKAKYTYKPQGKRRIPESIGHELITTQDELPGFGSSKPAEQVLPGSLRPVDEYMIVIQP